MTMLGLILQEGGGALAAFGLLFTLLPPIVFLITVAGMWKIFTKAGRPGWAAIVPIYNIWVLTKIGDSGVLWFVLSVLFGLPVIKIYIDVLNKFDKGIGYALGMFFLPFVFFPLLGFGDAQFRSRGATRA
ncbi:signal peptidase I [Halobacteriales archaeon SW_5_70_135]|nr:MAG: signal peptidase I [Halobacteriales archaeon SW_5_70_135]